MRKLARTIFGLNLIWITVLGGCGGPDQAPDHAAGNEFLANEGVADPFPHRPTDAGTPDEPPSYSLDDSLRLNEIQMKGSHNSYHLASKHPEAPTWSQYTLPTLREQLAEHGVRQFELDVHFNGSFFEVYHLPELDERTTCRKFTECMGEIAQWSAEHPGHHPIIVFLELKDEWDEIKIPPHVHKLDDELLQAVPRHQLLTPDDVRRHYYGLQEAVAMHGWPTLGETRGKIMVVIMDEGEGAYRYTHNGTTLRGRAMFVTLSGWPFGVIMTIDNVLEQKDFIYESVVKGKFVRSRVDDLPGRGVNYQAQLDAALKAGAHMVATDYPVDYTVDGYAVRIPGGTPSGCNPVTARAECKALLVENPQLLTPND